MLSSQLLSEAFVEITYTFQVFQLSPGNWHSATLYAGSNEVFREAFSSSLPPATFRIVYGSVGFVRSRTQPRIVYSSALEKVKKARSKQSAGGSRFCVHLRRKAASLTRDSYVETLGDGFSPLSTDSFSSVSEESRYIRVLEYQ